jgi:hypothetical protein
MHVNQKGIHYNIRAVSHLLGLVANVEVPPPVLELLALYADRFSLHKENINLFLFPVMPILPCHSSCPRHLLSSMYPSWTEVRDNLASKLTGSFALDTIGLSYLWEFLVARCWATKSTMLKVQWHRKLWYQLLRPYISWCVCTVMKITGSAWLVGRLD